MSKLSSGDFRKILASDSCEETGSRFRGVKTPSSGEQQAVAYVE